MTQPVLPRAVWTHDHFDDMGWHDCAIHGIGLRQRDDSEAGQGGPCDVLIDLDYIVESVSPATAGGPFDFWICPSTLVFVQAQVVEGSDWHCHWGSFFLEIDGLERGPTDEHDMRIWTLTGDLTLRVHARGFVQYLRRPPVLSRAQWLSAERRGGLSFEERAYET